MLKWSAKVPRGAPHTKGIQKNLRWSYQKWMDWSINVLSWETFPPFFLHGIPLPDIKVVEVFIPKTPRDLCSFGCLLCIITYQKKNVHLKNPSSFASPKFTPPAVVGCFHPSFLGTSLASTSSAHNAACCVTSTSAKAKRASKGSCRDNCPLRKSGSWSRHGVVAFGWSLGVVAASWFLVRRDVVFFWGSKYNKIQMWERER